MLDNRLLLREGSDGDNLPSAQDDAVTEVFARADGLMHSE